MFLKIYYTKDKLVLPVLHHLFFPFAQSYPAMSFRSFRLLIGISHIMKSTLETEVNPMAAAHKGAISFGLVHIPVVLYKTTSDHDISFNQLCRQSMQRVQYKKFCANCDKELKAQDIVKGYQYEKDKYVVMSQKELDAIKSEKDRTIHILQFCALHDIDDIYYEKNYYAIPDSGSEKAYELLRSAMQRQDQVAIAKTVLGTKETLMALCPQSECILMKTLFYQDEVLALPKTFAHPNISKDETKIAEQLISTMSAPFDPNHYHDEYQQRLMDAIQKKIQGQDIVSGETIHKEDHIVDLMDALKQSIAMQKKDGSQRKRAVRH